MATTFKPDTSFQTSFVPDNNEQSSFVADILKNLADSPVAKTLFHKEEKPVVVPEASRKYAAAHPLPEEPGLKEIMITPTMPLLSAANIAMAGNETPVKYPFKAPAPLQGASEMLLPKTIGDVPNFMSYFGKPRASMAYGAVKAAEGQGNIGEEALTRAILPPVIEQAGAVVGAPIRKALGVAARQTPTEIEAVIKGIVDKFKAKEPLTAPEQTAYDNWLKRKEPFQAERSQTEPQPKTPISKRIPAAELKDAKKSIQAEFDKLNANKPTEPELQGVYNTQKRGLYQMLKNIDAYAEKLKQGEAFNAPLRFIAKGAEPLSKEEKDRLAELAKGFINLKNINSKDPETIVQAGQAIKAELEQAKGKVLSNAEVVSAAKDASILQKTFSREQTLAEEAAILRARQSLAAGETEKGITKEYLNTLKSVSEYATARARSLQALGIKAEPIEANAVNKNELIKRLLKIGIKTDDILERGKLVDWTNLNDVTKFYRTFVKPTMGEVLDEYRYINLLSSPKTHIVNFTSNLLQVAGLAPATKLATGAIDAVGAAMGKRARQAYAGEAGAYYKGAVNNILPAVKQAIDVIAGKAKISRPDLVQIPTGNKLLKLGALIPRALEASDVLFRTIAEGGEKNSLAYRYAKQGQPITEAMKPLIEEMAKNKAAYSIFRAPTDAENLTGQGYLLSAVDHFTQKIVKPLRRDLKMGNKTIWNPAKLLIPFVETPMNIFKQGIEYSPTGVLTLPGAKNTEEQLAKAMIGSTVALGALGVSLTGNATWKAPQNENDKKIFYASGRQPYSVRIGNKWVGYSRLGPIAYPIALATAINWYLSENPKAATEANEKRLINVLSGIGGFFADQSYVQGLNNILQIMSGDVRSIQNLVANAPSQYIPLSSLLRWTNTMIDQVYRQSDKDFSVKSTIQKLATGIPGASLAVPPITGPEGLPEKRQMPFLNAVSPLSISTVNPKYDALLKSIYSSQSEKLLDQKTKEQLIKELKANPKAEDEILTRANEIDKTGKLGDKIMRIIDSDEVKLTPEEVVIKKLSPQAKANYLLKATKEMRSIERDKYFEELDNKGVMGNDVWDYL